MELSQKKITSRDNCYLNEDPSVVKDSFVVVADEIDDGFSGTIADVGCAAGAFPAYLSQRFCSANVFGVEYLESLRLKAEKDFPKLHFMHGDVTDKSSVNKKFDVITMLGVLCIFDDYAQVLTNVISWLNPKGKLILHNLISEYDIDVIVKHAPSSHQYSVDNLESGFNIISEKSLGLVCRENSANLVKVKPLRISVDIEQNIEDIIRSWTELDTHQIRQIYNALHIRQPQKIAVIEKC